VLKFLWLWALLAAPLPLAVWWLWPRARANRGSALRIPFFAALQGIGSATRVAAPRWVNVTMAVGWLLLLVAAARPQWVGEPVGLPVTGRDLMLAVDISGSMKTRDMETRDDLVSRLEVVKAVAGEFIGRREGDRLGLILFGTRAYLQTPLTFDRATVEALLEEAEIGFAGERTAIGDAIGLAVKRLRHRDADRVLILLTDGANTAGAVAPLRAAELAASAGLTIYTIGVGADELLVRSFAGVRRVNPSIDLDEATLSSIAELTSGRYFRARDRAALDEIYAIIDKLEPAAGDLELLRPVTELYVYPLGILVLLVLWWMRPGLTSMYGPPGISTRYLGAAWRRG